MSEIKEKRVARWYFGGLASAGAACVTHPLDTLKVHLQTQQEGKASIFQLVGAIIKRDGVMGLYNGLSASLLRQLTYSTARFAFYETAKQSLPPDHQGFMAKIAIAGAAGGLGGWIGVPTDIVNVRMQNDMKLPKDQRRNYKNAIDGLIRIYKEETVWTLWKGASLASTRAALMSIGQLSFYDQTKLLILKSGILQDNPTTHFLSSLIAAGVATTLTMPIDVIKTRFMNAKYGEYSGVTEVIMDTAKLGPLAFFKGFTPAFVRIAPQTILIFISLEQMTNYFGYIKVDDVKKIA